MSRERWCNYVCNVCLFVFQCFPRLTEMGIMGFWDMVNIAENKRNEHLSMRDHIMQVPPVGRVRCLEALMAEVDAAPPPESLRHSVGAQEKLDIMAEYRGMLECVLRKHMLHVWQGCARQLFAAADPVKFIVGVHQA